MCRVELHWIPLGAGGWFVRRNGIIYEWLLAHAQRRPAQPLHHAALSVYVDGRSFVIELCPESSDLDGCVAGGPVGSPSAGRLRIFRYVARCAEGGLIPDLEYAVGDPQVVSRDTGVARMIVALAPGIPTPTWGRDELAAGEMWNSNSVIAWLLVRAGVDAEDLRPPFGGRAPGWNAGCVVARRSAG